MTMKLRELESLLSEVDLFPHPKVELEQIPTSAHLAARMMFTAANEFEDIAGCDVMDLGCGTGMLSIASFYLGASGITSFDIDSEALEVAKHNCSKLEIADIDFVQANVADLCLHHGADTVVMNPPFGTRNAGIDTAFVVKAMEMANVAYSLHKTSTREHFIKLAKREGWQVQVLAELRYDIPRTFKHHRQGSKDVFVDLLRFQHVS